MGVYAKKIELLTSSLTWNVQPLLFEVASQAVLLDASVVDFSDSLYDVREAYLRSASFSLNETLC